jgi:hypothetical protein
MSDKKRPPIGTSGEQRKEPRVDLIDRIHAYEAFYDGLGSHQSDKIPICVEVGSGSNKTQLIQWTSKQFFADDNLKDFGIGDRASGGQIILKAFDKTDLESFLRKPDEKFRTINTNKLFEEAVELISNPDPSGSTQFLRLTYPRELRDEVFLALNSAVNRLFCEKRQLTRIERDAQRIQDFKDLFGDDYTASDIGSEVSSQPRSIASHDAFSDTDFKPDSLADNGEDGSYATLPYSDQYGEPRIKSLIRPDILPRVSVIKDRGVPVSKYVYDDVNVARLQICYEFSKPVNTFKDDLYFLNDVLIITKIGGILVVVKFELDSTGYFLINKKYVYIDHKLMEIHVEPTVAKLIEYATAQTDYRIHAACGIFKFFADFNSLLPGIIKKMEHKEDNKEAIDKWNVGVILTHDADAAKAALIGHFTTGYDDTSLKPLELQVALSRLSQHKTKTRHDAEFVLCARIYRDHEPSLVQKIFYCESAIYKYKIEKLKEDNNWKLSKKNEEDMKKYLELILNRLNDNPDPIESFDDTKTFSFSRKITTALKETPIKELKKLRHQFKTISEFNRFRDEIITEIQTRIRSLASKISILEQQYRSKMESLDEKIKEADEKIQELTSQKCSSSSGAIAAGPDKSISFGGKNTRKKYRKNKSKKQKTSSRRTRNRNYKIK